MARFGASPAASAAGSIGPCRRATSRQSRATSTPMRDVPTKNHANPVHSITKPENPASRLPGRAQSEVSRAYWLAAWAALNTVVSFYYYVRFIRAMYLGERAAEARPLSLSPALTSALVVCAVFVILIGVYPHPVIKMAEALVSTLAAGAVALR